MSIMGVPLTIEAANLGMADSLILMVMALVVFGPRRLPQIGRQIGKLMYEFRKASNDFKFQMEEELRNAEEADRRKKEEEERQRQLTASPTPQLEAGADSQTSETTSATDTTYPYSGSYAEVTDAQALAEETYPQIHPPATGEPISAEWPGGDVAVAEPVLEASVEPEAAAVEAPVASAVPLEEKAPLEETSTVTEPAAHNG